MKLASWLFCFGILATFLHAESIMQDPLGLKPKIQPQEKAIEKTIKSPSKTITLAYLQSKPKGIVRDFYIWMFLDQDISKEEADAANQLIHRQNTQLFGRYFKKGSNRTIGRKTICQRMSLDELLKQDATCIGYALKLSDASQLPKTTLKQLSNKLKKANPKLSQQLALLSSPKPLTSILKSGAKNFATIFNGVDLSYRIKELDQAISPSRLAKLANENNQSFSKLLQIIIMNSNYPKIQESLAKTDGITKPDSKTLFYLGMNALKYKHTNRAIEYFKKALAKVEESSMRDRTLFWLYKTTQDSQYLKRLAQSGFPSIYALYATQTLQTPPAYNIVYHVFDAPVPKASSYNITDPFKWLEIQNALRGGANELERIINTLKSQDTEPHYALALRRKYNFKNHYYIRPYREAFSRYDPDRQALMYAIGLQESYFIPASVSTSYALGMMQIMPFNVESIAKKLNEKRHLTDMFNPYINLRYAEFLLRDLEAEFKHPLFIAYAYNGGSGFTRRMLAKKDLFRKSNRLDPWFSLEFVPYEESRNYGQKVLTNYIIYQRLYNKSIPLEAILQETLINP